MKRSYIFGEFHLEVDERRLLRNGEPIAVPPKVFDTLVLLVENSGHLVTKDEFMRRLWPDTFVGEDTLAQNISLLRRVLGGETEAQDYVATVPKRGYRFVATIAEMKQGNGAGIVKVDIPPDNSDQTKTSGGGQVSVVALKHRVPATLESGFPKGIGSAKFRLGWAAAIGVSLIVGLVAGGITFRMLSRTRAMHFSVPLSVAVRDVALSHNGQILAFIAPRSKQGGITLWVHEIGTSDARPLENTEGASYPYWSPDDKFIAFFADGKLKKIAAVGGPVQVLCDAPIGRGGTWNRDGVMVFARDSGVALYRVSAAGGAVTLVNGFEQKVATTLSSRWPVFLPDGRHFLYTSVDFGADLRSEASAIYLATLDSKEHLRLVTSNSNAAYLAPGYLLFLRNGSLMAQRFDADRLLLRGEAFAVANQVEYLSSVARALFSVSENGTLVFQSGSGATFSQLAWFDREGKQVSTLGTPARYANPRVSPDGKRVAMDIDDPQSSNTDIWLIDTTHQVPYRFTFDPSQDETPLWSHDGSRILWLSDRGGKNGFYLKASNGSEIEESPTLPIGVDLSFASAPSDWSSDGRFLLYTDLQEGDTLHLWVLPMNGDRKPYRLLPGTSADVEGQFSPDGHWVAYSSNESGTWQVYVAPFPGPGGKYQISTGGGQQPRWRRDGKELFFLSRERKLMAVPLKAGPTFEFGAPVALFESRAHEPLTAEEFFTYDVSSDGQRFLINANAEQKDVRPIDILLNWSSQLKK